MAAARMTASAAPGEACFHCGEPIPAGVTLAVRIDGRERRMCCAGCQAVAEAIVGHGLAAYYEHREGSAVKPDDLIPAALQQLTVYDEGEVQRRFLRTDSVETAAANLVLEGVTCAACAWLLESRLNKLPGVARFEVNYSTRQAALEWRPHAVALSTVLGEIRRLGYKAFPFDASKRQALLVRERKYYLRRLGVAALCGMQVMMVAFALYFSESADLEPKYERLLQWLGLVFTVPVMGYAAQPFYVGAWRALRQWRVNMDVSVTLGIVLAFAGSLWAVMAGGGPVYFDSVTMFVALLLLSRYLELSARSQATTHIDHLARIVPVAATRIGSGPQGDVFETIAVTRLRPGDRILVKPGETLPVDGRVSDGVSSVDESILTGESAPIRKQPGMRVISGSTNIDSPLQIEVTTVGEGSFLMQVMQLIERAQTRKPVLTELAQRISGGFIALVIALAGVTALYYLAHMPAQWLPATVAVLVVSCPCALAIATPIALTAASSNLMRRGIALIHPNALDALATATDFVFDKTGTLTTGRLVLAEVRTLAAQGRDAVLAIAAALEVHSEHPVARAVLAATETRQPASEVRNYPGEGIAGRVAEMNYLLGSGAFIAARHPDLAPGIERLGAGMDDKTAFLATAHGELLAAFVFSDQLRPGAMEALSYLERKGLGITILSGDHARAVARVAGDLGLAHARAGLTPPGKLAEVSRLQAARRRVVAVGDGVNDAPILAQANVSFALNEAADHAKLNADLIVLREGLDAVSQAHRVATLTRAVVRQNIAWSIAYNVLALPLALAGFITPWIGALGMSLSSLLVIANAARIYRER